MVLVYFTPFRPGRLGLDSSLYRWYNDQGWVGLETSMDLKKAIKTKKFIDEMAVSIRNIVFDAFPGTTPQEREDIEQDVKLKIWRAAVKGKNFTNFRSYLWRVVYTTALDAIARRIKNLEDDEIEKICDSLEHSRRPSENPEFLCQNKESLIHLKEAINLLPERRKAVLQLWLLDMNLEEIAAHLGWSSNQVRHLLYRGIEELRGLSDNS